MRVARSPPWFACLFAGVALAGCLVGDEPGLDPQVAKVVHVDPDRWSGEPSILAMQDGTLLITGAGGFTRYAEDPSDAPGNAGQSYIWRSTDDGDSWEFMDLDAAPDADPLLPYRNAIFGVEGDLAEDQDGRAYFVDLTMLAANGVAASDDSGATWTAAQNPVVGAPGTDRPWVAAYGSGHVYMKYLQTGTGHRVAVSDDGGQTFLEDAAIPSCSQADMTVDLDTQEVLLPCTGGDLSILRTGPGPMMWERVPVRTATGDPVNGSSAFVFPSMAVAGPGQYVFAWAQPTDEGAEVRVTASTDRGQTWTEARTLSTLNRTGVFAWVDADPDGTVGVVWYEADRAGDPDAVAAETQWRVHHASLRLTEDGLSDAETVVVTEDAIHKGAICTAGLGCVLDGRSEDRRLLDFFEVDVDDEGRSHITWTSTRTVVPTIWYGQVTTATA